MNKYVAEQVTCIIGQNVAVMKFGETESIDGTVQEVREGPEEAWLTLSQHGDEKIVLSQIEEIYLLIDGYLPIYYSPLDDYDEENFFYPPEFFEAFYDFIGEKVKFYGSFEGSYCLTGVLEDADPESLTLDVEGRLVNLWEINIAFAEDENGEWAYIPPEELAEGFEEPLDNLYSLEDFEMLLGKKVRIKTMNPEVEDEIATVIGYSLEEGYSGEEVYHLELEEFPDLMLEPSEIQFIYLIGEDGSETLVEPSGGSLYGQKEGAEEEEEGAVDKNVAQDSEFYATFVNDIASSLRPYKSEDGIYHLQWLSFTEEEFKKVAAGIKEWYKLGTPAAFATDVSADIHICDSRMKKEWYLSKEAVEAGYAERPYKNIPCILIYNTAPRNKQQGASDFVFYSLSDIDKLNADFGLGLNNYELAAGSIYDLFAPLQVEPLKYSIEAILKYKEHLNHYPRHAVALNSIGYNLFLLAKYQEALDYLEQALNVHPHWVTPLANKINVLTHMHEFGKAAEVVALAQHLEPDQGEWYWYLSKVYEGKGDKEEAAKLAGEAAKRGYTSSMNY